MCGGGGGGGGGGGSVSRVSAPVVPQTPRYQGDPSPRTEVKPTPVFQDDVVEKPRAPKPPVVAKPPPRVSPLANIVEKVTNLVSPKRPPIETGETARPAPVAAKPAPAVRAAPPMPEIPVVNPEPVAPAPISRRPAPV